LKKITVAWFAYVKLKTLFLTSSPPWFVSTMMH